MKRPVNIIRKPYKWLANLGVQSEEKKILGLVRVDTQDYSALHLEQVAALHKAKDLGAHAVFFEAAQGNTTPRTQALIYTFDSESAFEDGDFRQLHRRIWSWGEAPLLYIKTPSQVRLYRSAHEPHLLKEGDDTTSQVVSILNLSAGISTELNEPWWHNERIHNGTLWDDPAACREFLSPGGNHSSSAHTSLIQKIKELKRNLDKKDVLSVEMRRKLLILSILVEYLKERGAFPKEHFSKYVDQATEFFEVLKDGEALIELLSDLEQKFNGHVFALTESEKKEIRESNELHEYSDLVRGNVGESGQLTLWRLYSFKDLPVELVSYIYEIFVKVEDANTSVYTPPFLARLMVDEVLDERRMERILTQNECILDPACGSGVFLVEAYKRLILYWRKKNKWKPAPREILQELLDKVHGIDIDRGAIELSVFSLCLAMCDELDEGTIQSSRKLFPPLQEKTLHNESFFRAKKDGVIKKKVGVILGNPPFTSDVSEVSAQESYDLYTKEHGRLPDKQLAYLFLHEAMKMLAEGGILCMLQQYNFLYNQNSENFRKLFLERWNVREVLDFISIPGLFQSSNVNTEVLAIVAESQSPRPGHHILHLTFRKDARVRAEEGFSLDHYDFHWVSLPLAINNPHVWHSNLLGGDRVRHFADRLKDHRTLKEYADEQKWNYGEGFIVGNRTKEANYLFGKKLLETEDFTENYIDEAKLSIVKEKHFGSPRRKEIFNAPLLLIKERWSLPHALWIKSESLAYKDDIIGFSAPETDIDKLVAINNWLCKEDRNLKAYAACISSRLFTRRRGCFAAHDIYSLPYPESGTLDLSDNEKIVADDIVNYYVDFINKGDSSIMAATDADESDLVDFSKVFTRQINGVYNENPLVPLERYEWSGIVCQPFVFGEGTVDWEDADSLRDKLWKLLREQPNQSLLITRIARIYDGKFIFLLKPRKLRYWLKSNALRDADETLIDMVKQGF